MPLDILSFVRKWNASTLTERSGAPQHFRDLCEALGVAHPTEAEATDSNYTYEKHVAKTGGGQGFADVWKRGYFAWEYKSKGGNLTAAYKQINEYHEALENPPLLIVCDFVRFEVHTKFENLPSRTYAFTLDDILVDRDTPTCALPPLEVLRHVFGDYNQLRPNVTAARVTEAAASDFLRLAQRLELERAISPTRPAKEEIAHFLMRLVFCLFADSVGLLPDHAFRRLVLSGRTSLRGFNKKLPVLFEAMSSTDGFFGADDIAYFNGGLFTDNSTIELDHADMGVLISASQHDWSHIEPAIFGTLFERSLDDAKRSLIGAHYTSTDDILLLVEPVIMQPLRRRWDATKTAVLAALEAESAPTTELSSRPESAHSADAVERPAVGRATKARRTQPTLNLNRPALTLLQDFAAELSAVRILDPACGSGNFLYVALKRLLDLWQEARNFGLLHGLTITLDPMPNPAQLFGIEIDFYAHEIASIVVWIGFLQWKHDHGVKDEKEPLLRKLTNIEHGDAIMRYDAEGQAYEPSWPDVNYIVGNPPFLGDKRMRAEMGDEYVTDLRRLYAGRVPGGADLVTYWFEGARARLGLGGVKRVGLLATQGIRGETNRVVLERIKNSGRIFYAYADRNWVLGGAMVHVSIIAFDDGSEQETMLDGEYVVEISAALTGGIDLTKALRLGENEGLAYIGDMKKGSFDIASDVAERMLRAIGNPNGKNNREVVKPFLNARDVTDRSRQRWIVDFADMGEAEAALFEEPFEYVRFHEKKHRDGVRNALERSRWWQHGRVAKEMRVAVSGLSRFIVTPRHSKHRMFTWVDPHVLPDSALVVFARDDDFFFGLLHSRVHELWSRGTGTQVRDVESGFRYTPNSTFDTFPFPWPPGKEPTDDPRVEAIAAAARELVRLRNAWLNPPDIPEADLKKRTLTNLYNERPTWLANAHRRLDEAVFAAYNWPPTLTNPEILANLLALNHERAALGEG